MSKPIDFRLSAVAKMASQAAAQSTVLICLLTLAACGTDMLDRDEFLYENPQQLQASDSVGDGGTEPQDGATADTASNTDTATAADTAPEDTGKTADCETDFDCLDIKGKTPCKVPKCNGGKCELELRPEGTVCTNPLVTLKECERSLCDDAGACEVQPKKEGTACGFGVCGKLCKEGVCEQATDKDYDDDNPCTKDYCKQGTEVVHEPITDLSLGCDDENPCTENEYCAGGKCLGQPTDCDDGFSCTVDACEAKTGCIHTPNNASCDDGDPCTKDACDLAAGCTVTAINVAAKCNDGNACSENDACDDEGECVGKNICACTKTADCDSKNLCIALLCEEKLCVVDEANTVKCDDSADTECAKAACEPTKGKCVLEPIAAGTSCDDGDACTTLSKCKDGECEGSGKLDCNDNNPCTNDACEPVDGCTNAFQGGKCDDGSACTSDDNCVAAGCVGKSKDCDDGVVCTADSCDPKSGDCVHTPTDAQCDDDNLCTTDKCNSKDDCKYVANDAGACDDGDACTKDACKAGKCAVADYLCACKTAADCDDKNPCTQDSCDSGSCKNVSAKDGAKCTTANKCDVPDSGSCKAGKCEGGTAKDCSDGLGPCQTGACSPSTGKCETLAKSDGTSCDADKTGCTVGDACVAGKCIKGEAADCSDAEDSCNAGVCQADGTSKFKCIKKPKAKDTACDDGEFCTLSDKCNDAGKCVGGATRSCAEEADACNTGKCDAKQGKCIKDPKKDGTACDDGAFCTVSETCDGLGNCSGGKLKPCDGGNCKLGSCDEAAGKCATKDAPEGTECTDDNACTTEDRCNTAGKCIGAQPKTCNAAPCKVASCDAKTGDCVLKAAPDGGSCNDGNACTAVDKCVGGSCKGSDNKVCQGDACNTGTCNTQSGNCEKLPKSGTPPCSDGNACTSNDVCKGGACTAGKFVCACKVHSDCDDKKTCTKDECISAAGKKTCKSTPLTGAPCADGNPCTTGDRCEKGACNGNAKSCGDGNDCTSDYCDSANGNCVNKIQTGKECSDGNACSNGDKCDLNGVCKGTAITCNDGKGCTNDACKDGKCVFTNNTASCSDGNDCTVNDKCKDGKCNGTPKNCDDKNTCTADSCVSGKGCQHSATNYKKSCATNKFCLGTACTCKVHHETSGATASNETWYKGAQIKGSGLLLVGRRYVSGSKWDAACRTVGNNGKYTSNTVLFKGSTNDDHFKSVVRLNDGTYLAVGKRYHSNIGDDANWIVRLSSTCGKKADITHTFSGDDQFLQGVAPTPDGGAFAVGSRKKIIKQFGVKFTLWLGTMLKLDKTLKVTKAVTFGDGDHASKPATYLRSVKTNSKGEAVAVGHSSFKSNKGSQDGAVVGLTPTGGTKFFLRHGSSSDDELFDVSHEGSTAAWAVGWSDQLKSTKGRQHWMIKFDVNNGNLLVDKKHGGGATDQLYGVGIWNNQRVMVGRTYDGNSAGSAVAYHFSSSGSITRTKIMKPSSGGSVYEGFTFFEDARAIALGSGYNTTTKSANPWYTILGPALETSCN